MKRAILRVPEGLRFVDLTEEQQLAIESVFAEFVLPLPGTVPAGGYELVGGLTGDNFDPSVMPGLDMDWPIVGVWQWDGDGDQQVIVPLDEAALLAHLPPTYDLDEDGVIIGTHPPVLHMPHNWLGWPPIL